MYIVHCTVIIINGHAIKDQNTDNSVHLHNAGEKEVDEKSSTIFIYIV